jgi:hypothetical protein
MINKENCCNLRTTKCKKKNKGTQHRDNGRPRKTAEVCFQNEEWLNFTKHIKTTNITLKYINSVITSQTKEN